MKREKKPVFYYASINRPAFYLIRYADVINLSGNKEIMFRLGNVLKEINGEAIVNTFGQHLNNMVSNKADKGSVTSEHGIFSASKVDYVYSVIFDKKFARSLNKALQDYIADDNKISPSLYSFVKQLENIVVAQERLPYKDESDFQDEDYEDNER